LIDLHCDVNVIHKYEGTPAHLAARKGYVEVLKLLHREGADLSLSDRFGNLPLHEAAENGHYCAVAYLLDSGVHADATEDGKLPGKTALMRAALRGHLEVVKLLITRGARLDHRYKEWCDSPLHEAALCGHDNVVQELIQRGMSVNDDRGFRHSTPLIKASKGGHLSTMKLLVAAGAAVSQCDENGDQALHADPRKRTETVSFLLDSGADINAVNKAGETVLHAAAWNRSTALLEMLLDRGADVNAVSHGYGSATALHTAALTGDANMVEFLLGRGADPNICSTRSGSSETPMDEAIKHESLSCIRLLLTHGCKPTNKEAVRKALRNATEARNLELIQLVLENDVKMEDANWWDNPLKTAVQRGYIDVVQIFMRHGSTVVPKSALPEYNTSLVEEAAKANRFKMVDLLLSVMPAETVKGEVNYVATCLAKSDDRGREKMLRYLEIRHGAVVDYQAIRKQREEELRVEKERRTYRSKRRHRWGSPDRSRDTSTSS
jgi:uncharacterized protein